MRLLITGTAGFIGNALALSLLERGDTVAGLDIVNDYYDPALKEARLARVKDHSRFCEARIPLEDKEAVEGMFREFRPERVVHRAAQVGVRQSFENPHSYVESNIVGFMNILEGCRRHGIEHLVFASSSSVYGANTRMPYSVHDKVDRPISLYAATKKSNELMAHAYSYNFRLPVTGLRFFTVYGPWGRPDMAVFKFTKAIIEGKPIEVFNHGKTRRDFTYIDDAVQGVLRVLDTPATANGQWSTDNPDTAGSDAPYRLYNIGNASPVELLEVIKIIESNLKLTAEKIMLPPVPGDMEATCAEVDDLELALGFRPGTQLEQGIEQFVDWYWGFYGE